MVSGLARCVRHACLFTALAALIALADPMGLDQASDRHSADVISRIIAPLYGRDSGRQGQSQIAVIEVSDHTINANDLDWPPPRAVYGGLLRRLTADEKNRPAVVFFDYAFISTSSKDDRERFLRAVREVTAYKDWDEELECQRSALAKIHCIFEKGGVPVVIGKGYPPNACLAGLKRVKGRVGDVELFHTAAVVPLGWPDLPNTFRLTLTREDYVEALETELDGMPIGAASSKGSQTADACDDLNANLKLDPPPPGPTSSDAAADPAPVEGAEKAPPPPLIWAPLGLPADGAPRGYDVTPATAMAYALCLRNRSSTPLCPLLIDARAQKGRPTLKTEVFSGPEWGSITDPANQKALRIVHGRRAPGPKPACERERRLLRPIEVGWIQLGSGLGESEAAVAVPCPYHLTLDADVFAGNSDEDLVVQAELSKLLAGRAVAIGAAQALSNDWIPTTLSDRQAGVHYHAMTLDNLIERGKEFRRPPSNVFDWGPLSWPGLVWLGLDWGDVLELSCAFLILLMIQLVRERAEASRTTDLMAWPAFPKGGSPRRRRTLYQEQIGRYLASGQAVRYRMALVAGAFAAAFLLLALAVALTVVLRWTPVNVVGLMALAVVAVAANLWSREGLATTIRLSAAAATLALLRSARWLERSRRFLRRRRLGTRTAAPAQATPPSPTPQPPEGAS